MPDVRVGDVWADNDRRSVGRRLKVLEVTPLAVVCRAGTGRESTILRRRFRPNSTGYRLVERDGRPVEP